MHVCCLARHRQLLQMGACAFSSSLSAPGRQTGRLAGLAQHLVLPLCFGLCPRRSPHSCPVVSAFWRCAV